ncbi:MAG: hypothetical protein ACYC5Y_14665 [Symbiobacteriia bacterium]
MLFGGTTPGLPGGTTPGGNIAMQCVTGFVYLYRFFATPAPGSVIGQITTSFGAAVPLIQTEANPLGGISLSAVDGSYATVCGLPSTVGGQYVLDVRVVNPGAPSPTGTPFPYDKRPFFRWPFSGPPSGDPPFGGTDTAPGLGLGRGGGLGSRF